MRLVYDWKASFSGIDGLLGVILFWWSEELWSVAEGLGTEPKKARMSLRLLLQFGHRGSMEFGYQGLGDCVYGCRTSSTHSRILLAL